MCQELNIKLESTGGPEAAAALEKLVRELVARTPGAVVVAIEPRRATREVLIAEVQLSEDRGENWQLHRQLGIFLGYCGIRTVADLAARTETNVRQRVLRGDEELMSLCRQILHHHNLEFAAG